jgi:hypothetical protein
MRRLPVQVETVYDDWVRQRRTGYVELHFVNGELRSIKVSATMEVTEVDRERTQPWAKQG